MATATLNSEFTLTSQKLDRQRGLDLWLRTWVVLLLGIAATVVAYLIFISNALVGINGHLGAARSAVTDVSGHAKTLPEQISTVNANLSSINDSLKSIPSQADAIRTNLASVASHGAAIHSSLSNTAGLLSATATDLSNSAPMLTHITSQLADTSQLLTTILHSTSSIESNLQAVQGSGPAGVIRINSTVEKVVGALQPTQAGLSDILSGLGSINTHLDNVCESLAINLLHGKQPC